MNRSAINCIARSCYILLSILCLCSGVKAQTYDVYIDNKVMTSNNTFEFDVYIRSNGTTGTWALRTYQSGYRFNPDFVNGGTLTGSYVAGSSELEATFGKTWGFSYSAGQSILNQSSNTGSACPGGIIGATPRKIMRIMVTNTVNWGCENDSIAFNLTGAGALALAVTKYDDITCSALTIATVTSGATPYTVSIPTRTEAFACSSYVWHGTTYSTSGTYTFDYTNPAGCALSDTLVLVIGSGAATWTGTVSEAWENPANWNCATVPDATTIVYINESAPNFPVISSIAFCKKIITPATTTVTILPGARLNVAGTD